MPAKKQAAARQSDIPKHAVPVAPATAAPETSAADDIISGLNEIIAMKRAGVDLATRFIVRTYSVPAPSDWPPARVRELRGRLGVGQAVFAKLCGVSHILTQGWEQGKRTPAPLAARLLDTIAADPAKWLATIGAEVPSFPRTADNVMPAIVEKPAGRRAAKRRKAATAA